MIQIRELDHLVLRAQDPQTMIAFYCDVLGCDLEKTQAKFGLYQLRAGQSIIDIVSVDGELGRMGGRGPEQEGRNLDHFCLRVDPFDEANIREHLANHSIYPEPSAPRYGAEGVGPSLYITDPENNVVELKGPPTVG
ncbi:MAG: VOC family protein [Pseudomonadota bacterium]